MKNDLQKYSYALCTLTGSQAHNGTGFLYKKGDNVYIITNYHLRGMNPIDQKTSFDATELYIKMPLTDSTTFEIIKLPIDTNEVGSLRTFFFLNDLDLFSMKLKNIPINAELNVINDLINPELFDSVPNKILVYGFPPYEEKQSQILDVKLDTFISKYEHGSEELKQNLLAQQVNNQFIEEAVNFHSQHYFFAADRAHGGNSGAPVIGEYDLRGKKVYAFAGVVFGWSVLEKTWCIKPRIANDYFQSLK